MVRRRRSRRVYRSLPIARELGQIRAALQEIKDVLLASEQSGQARATEERAHEDRLERDLLEVRNLVGRLASRVDTIWSLEIAQTFDGLLAHDARYQDPTRLLKYSYGVNSLAGEDGMIQEIFRRIGTTSRVFVEIGVGDGVENNTAFLTTLGWTGFWIDSGVDFQHTVAEHRAKGVLAEGSIVDAVAHVTRENIAVILDEMAVPAEYDLLSVDVDANTYYIWEGLAHHRPRVVVIEYNALLPPSVDWKMRYDPDQTWDHSIRFGASLKSLEDLGRRLGYSLVGCDFSGTNAFFVRTDVGTEAFAPPFTAENHYEPFRHPFARPRGHNPSLLDPATMAVDH